MEKVRTAVIGLGQRGSSLINHLFLGMDNCEIVAVCDLYQDKVDAMVEKLKKEKGVIIDSNLGQEMLATGVLNPFKNSEASKVEMRDGYCGEIDGVACYKVSPILLKLAAKYCQANNAQLAETAFEGIDAMVCSAVGTIRGFSSTTDIEVVPAQQGQGWVLQPLVHGGCVCISGKSVRLIVKSDFVNPATADAKITILPPESQPAVSD